MLYNGHLVIADTFLWNRLNHGQTLIEKPLYSGHYYSGHWRWDEDENRRITATEALKKLDEVKNS